MIAAADTNRNPPTAPSAREITPTAPIPVAAENRTLSIVPTVALSNGLVIHNPIPTAASQTAITDAPCAASATTAGAPPRNSNVALATTTNIAAAINPDGCN